jgi:exosortase/archaeosortase family protein
MKRFIALYLLFLGGLFIFFYAPTSAISLFINELQTKLTLDTLTFFLKPEQIKGVDIWVNPQYKIMITKACNGMIPILFLYASILAYPATFMHKVLWIVWGYIVFFIVNIARILWVVYITEHGEGHGDFYWSHDLIGNLLLIVVGLGLFIGFIRSSNRSIKN